MNRPTTQRACAFTLIEVVLSLALASIVLMGMTSAIVLASRAMPDSEAQAAYNNLLDVAAAAARIADEARFALFVSELTPRAITFTTPDRDHDGYPDRIRYHWSGESGDPLYRSVNGGDDAVVVGSVAALAFATDVESYTLTYRAPDVRGSETAFSAHTSTSDDDEERVDEDDWLAQVVRPGGAPNDAVRWEVSRAFLYLKREGYIDGLVPVSVRRLGAKSAPGSEVLDSVDLFELYFGLFGFEWEEAVFSAVPTLLRGQQAAIVIGFKSELGGSTRALVSDLSSMGIGYHDSNDAGNSWSYDDDETLLHVVYGHYWSPGPLRTLTRQRHTRLTITLQPTADAGSGLRCGVNLANKPPVADAYWRLAFDEPNPTAVDVNGDGAGDWAVRDGAAFNPADIAAGVWNGTQIIDTRPDNLFTQPVTVELTMRASIAGLYSTLFTLNADWSGSNNATISGMVGKEYDGSQTFHLFTQSQGIVATVTGLPDDTLDVMLVVDPTHDEMALFIDGVHRGVFAYTTGSAAFSDLAVSIYRLATGAEFHDITVTVGGSY